jgi:tetratricopeptide (TPR) repeat protein
MGNLYIDMGRASEAISAFSKAIGLDHYHVNAWTNLGLLYQDLNMYKEAETVMREAMSIMPHKPRFYFSLGVLLGRLQRLEVFYRTHNAHSCTLLQSAISV